MRLAASTLGTHLKRIPDGEVGIRRNWILFQPDVLSRTPGVERVGDSPIHFDGMDLRPLRVSDGVDPSSIVFEPLGYAAAAVDSFAVFERLRDAGVIRQGTRFQVSLPTPVAVVGAFFPPSQRPDVEIAYRAAVGRELDVILETIPHEQLAIQWDVAVEFQILENSGYGRAESGDARGWWPETWSGLLERAADQAAQVPPDVEVGFHLCYGDNGEKHFIEPADTGNLTRFANGIVAGAQRSISWLHMPVPIERDDDAFFAPLAGLALPAETELYLGLVHREDGIAGAHRRIAAALRSCPQFGVATECGFGRAPAGTAQGLLTTHARVAASWP